GGDAPSTLQVLIQPSGSATVEGVVEGADQLPRGSTGVVLVPDPPMRRYIDLYAIKVVDPQGQFAFSNVVPGRYKVFLSSGAALGAWENPDFLAQHEREGIAVAVASGSRTRVMPPLRVSRMAH